MNIKIEKIKNNFFTKEPNKIERGMAGAILLVVFLTMFYKDNLEIFTVHFNEVEKLINGQSLECLGSSSLPYGLLHQWMCVIWVLPINILYHLFGIEINSALAILWCKLYIVLFLFLCIVEMNNIAKTLEIKEKWLKWLQFLFLTSLLVALPVFHIAQTDSLYLFFMLKGFHALLKEDTNKFLLWFTLSVSFKLLTLFIFIPLILLEEKRILYIVRNILPSCLVILFPQMWYRIIDTLDRVLFPLEQCVASAVASIPNVETSIDRQMNFQLSMLKGGVLYFEFEALRKNYTASWMILLFTLLCIWCYMQKKEAIQEWKQTCLYGIVLALALFFTAACPMPYWIVIFYPFLYLLIFVNQSKMRLNLLLEKVFTLTTFLVYIKNFYWVFGGAQSFDNLFLVKWGLIPLGHELQGLPNIARYIEKAGIYEFLSVMTAICIASVVGIMYLNHFKIDYKEEMATEEQVKMLHGFAVFNILILYVWYVINVIYIGKY